MRMTVARSSDLDGLYVDGKLVKQGSSIDIDDVLLFSGSAGSQFSLEKKYLNEEWINKVAYILPFHEKDLVELDS
jgi:hypothetical protein